MRLRKLRREDAPGMFEWMTDPACYPYFRFDERAVTMKGVETFIESAQDHTSNRHYAIADDDDRYMGTISLKNISRQDRHAEYAIALRSCAFGRGIGAWATGEILRIAFEELELNKVYLNVLSDNARAAALYEKCGFRREGVARGHFFVRGRFRDFVWYGVLAADWRASKEAADGK